MTKETLDGLVRQIVRRKETRCFTCGIHAMSATMQVGHFVPRRYLATRWDLRNCHLQCAQCNMQKSGNIKEYRKKLGEKLADELWAKARANPKTNLETVYDLLRNILSESI